MTCQELIALQAMTGWQGFRMNTWWAQGNSGAAWAPGLCVWPIRHGPSDARSKGEQLQESTHTHIDDFHTSHHQCLKLEIEWNRYNMIQNRSKLHEIHWLASRLLKLLCFWGNLTDVLIFAHPLEEAGPSIKDGCLKKHTTCVTKAAVTIYYNRNLWQWPKQTESSRFGPVCLRHWLSSNCQIPGVQRF